MRLLFFLFIILLVAPFLFLVYLLAPTGLSDEKVTVVIPQDFRQEDIVAKLKSENFIRNTQVFTFVAGFIRFPGSIDPGSYRLSHRMNLFEIADTVLLHPYQRWIVLVPGLRVEQVAERLGKKFYWDNTKLQDFLTTAREGYMFPDTYLLNVDYTGKQFAERLIANFNDHFDAKLQKDLLSQNERNDTAVKVASLIERESGGDSDKALISGIIWNRLNSGMKLQIDATVQYALGTSSDWWPHVSPQDLKTDSPYNTYLIKALPPAPIDSPSLASIKAAVYPADTDCLFYLHDTNKEIHCAKTYEEHLRNIQNYLN